MPNLVIVYYGLSHHRWDTNVSARNRPAEGNFFNHSPPMILVFTCTKLITDISLFWNVSCN